MSLYGDHTINEILSQPASWASALAAVRAEAGAIRALLRRFADQPLLFSGCGSPYYLALSAATLLRAHAGRACMATPASEILLHPDTLLHAEAAPLLIAFSRSGETSEVIAAARAVQRRGGAVIAVGCDAAATLLRLADVAVEVAAGREQSLAQTRSFAGMFVAAQAIVALAAAERGGAHQALEDGLARLLAAGPACVERARSAVASLASDPAIARVFVLGSGSRYGLACEAALKFKEMALTDAEPFHTLEFRHGPLALADKHALVIGLVGEAGADEEVAVLREAHTLGARTVALLERAPVDPHGLDALFAFESQVPEPARDVLYLAPLQLMAYERAIAKGLNPDAPRNLVMFVRRPELEASGQLS
jgi:glucosamine--fructose-6-phosphate aminotransferase (isomerizing)